MLRLWFYCEICTRVKYENNNKSILVGYVEKKKKKQNFIYHYCECYLGQRDQKEYPPFYEKNRVRLVTIVCNGCFKVAAERQRRSCDGDRSGCRLRGSRESKRVLGIGERKKKLKIVLSSPAREQTFKCYLRPSERATASAAGVDDDLIAAHKGTNDNNNTRPSALKSPRRLKACPALWRRLRFFARTLLDEYYTITYSYLRGRGGRTAIYISSANHHRVTCIIHVEGARVYFIAKFSIIITIVICTRAYRYIDYMPWVCVGVYVTRWPINFVRTIRTTWDIDSDNDRFANVLSLGPWSNQSSEFILCISFCPINAHAHSRDYMCVCVLVRLNNLCVHSFLANFTRVNVAIIIVVGIWKKKINKYIKKNRRTRARVYHVIGFSLEQREHAHLLQRIMSIGRRAIISTGGVIVRSARGRAVKCC